LGKKAVSTGAKEGGKKGGRGGTGKGPAGQSCLPLTLPLLGEEEDAGKQISYG